MRGTSLDSCDRHQFRCVTMSGISLGVSTSGLSLDVTMSVSR